MRPPPIPALARPRAERAAVHLPGQPAASETFRVAPGRGRGPPAVRVVVLPGNPGAGAFYTRFAETLSDELGGAPVAVVSLLGHHPPAEARATRHSHAPLTLAGQVDHAAAFLTAELAHGAPVAVVGHSIGATLAARAVAAVEAAAAAAGAPAPPVAAVAALMPYARFNPCLNQRALAVVASAHRVAAAGAAAIARAPRRAQAAVLAATAGRGWSCDRAGDALLDFIKAGGTAHSLALARDEFAVLRHPPAAAWAPYAALGGRLAVLAAPGDHWCPETHWEEVRSAAPAASFAVLPAARHDFVTCATATADVAARVAAEVRRRL